MSRADRQITLSHTAKTLAITAGPLLLIGLLTWPMLFTSEGYTGEWINHLWLIWDESLSLQANHYPSFFLVTYHHSVFYPEFAFYGGTLNTMVGGLSLLLGDSPIVAYVATYVLGFVASYGGWYWLARMAGVERWWSHAPGVIFITSAYYLTLIYERGDLPEFIAVSMIPLMLASAVSILRNERLAIKTALALVVSTVVFAGSHPITLIWGTSVIAPACLLVLVFIPEARKLVTRRGVIRIAALVIPSLLISAWSLLPAIAYESHTRISVIYPLWRLTLREAEFLVAPSRIFTLSRSLVKKSVIELALELPVLAMAWSLLSVLVFSRAGLRGPWGRLLLICAGMGALITVIMTHVGLILALPRMWVMVEFSYRLESYVILATSGTVLVGLVLAQRSHTRSRYWAWALIPVLAVGIVGAIQQTSAYPAYGNRKQAITQHLKPGPREQGLLDYQDAALDQAAEEFPGGKLPEVDFPLNSVHHDYVSTVVHLRPGQRVYSNVGGGPELVHVSGATIVGLAEDGNDLLQIGPSIGRPKAASAGKKGPRWTEVISLSTASGPPIVIGRILSLGALLFLAGGLALLLARRIRASR